MRTAVQPLEGNKIKLSVEVEEQEFEKALDAAFRKIAREVRVPGFRPGKVPRRLLEARIGVEAARQEALREALPDYYARALRDADLDAIAPPEIDITGGEEGGGVTFDAVVEVRPQVTLVGYGGLRASVPNPVVSEEEVDAQVDRLRGQFGELQAVDRSARDGDHVTIDVSAERGGEALPGLTADDYLYEIGSAMLVPELDNQLRGAKVGDIVTFTSPVPGQDDEVRFRVLVKDVKEKVLPELTDEWVSEASEFETLDELRADIRNRLSMVKRMQAQLALQEEAVKALVELVDDEVPESLVNAEIERRARDMAHRLEHQGANLAQYLEATGTTSEQFVEQLKGEAVQAVKADLALRAVAEAEGIEVNDDEIDREVERLAERFGRKPAELRRELERGDQIPTVRSDLKKGKALEWLLEHVEVVDEEGRPIDRAALGSPEDETEQEGETES